MSSEVTIVAKFFREQERAQKLGLDIALSNGDFVIFEQGKQWHSKLYACDTVDKLYPWLSGFEGSLNYDADKREKLIKLVMEERAEEEKKLKDIPFDPASSDVDTLAQLIRQAAAKENYQSKLTELTTAVGLQSVKDHKPIFDHKIKI